MKHAPFLFAALILNSAMAQVDLLPGQLPLWSQQAWTELAARESLQISVRLDPAFWLGDFDGDGQQDLAVRVLKSNTKQEGIAFLLNGKAPHVIGAGRNFGNGGDNFDWMDTWQVETRGADSDSYRRLGLKLKVDSLMVAKEGSASALIYFRKGRPTWRQYGD